MSSVFHGEGYLLNDNRASGGALHEDGLLGCKHCQGLIDKSKWKQDGAFCHVCFSPVCTHCDRRRSQFGCEVFERTFAQAFEATVKGEQNRKILGV